MKNIKISILVPVYNVEQYLPRCIESVLAQDFHDWEMILVDDGSPDRCPQICDEYAAKDQRIKVVHKANGGLPSARQVGYLNATGEYLIFLDSDDWLLPNAISILINAIQSNGGYDIARSLVYRVSDNGNKWIEHYSVEKDLNEKDEFYSSLNNDFIAPYLHSGIYRASLFSDKIFQPLIDNRINVGEDWILNYYIAPKVCRMKFIDTPTYAYFLNTSSMMGSSVYGWEYYDRIKKCMSEINLDLGIKKQSGITLESALHELRFFFIPEVSFNWERFHEIQPIIVDGLKKRLKGNRTSLHKHLRFIRFGYFYYVYTILYRYTFLLLKLKGRKRKVLK